LTGDLYMVAFRLGRSGILPDLPPFAGSFHEI